MDTSSGFPRTPDSHLSSPGTESEMTLGTQEEVIPALLPHTSGIPLCCSLSEEVGKNSKGPDLKASYGFKVQRQPRTSHARRSAFQDDPAVLTEDSPCLINFCGGQWSPEPTSPVGRGVQKVKPVLLPRLLEREATSCAWVQPTTPHGSDDAHHHEP